MRHYYLLYTLARVAQRRNIFFFNQYFKLLDIRDPSILLYLLISEAFLIVYFFLATYKDFSRVDSLRMKKKQHLCASEEFVSYLNYV